MPSPTMPPPNVPWPLVGLMILLAVLVYLWSLTRGEEPHG